MKTFWCFSLYLSVHFGAILKLQNGGPGAALETPCVTFFSTPSLTCVCLRMILKQHPERIAFNLEENWRIPF